MLRRASFELIEGRVVRLPQGSMLSLGEVRFVSVGVDFVAGQQVVAGVLVLADCTVVDASSAQFFVNSSLAPVLLFSRRLKSVADILWEIRQHEFTQTGEGPGCRQGPCGPVCTLEPWVVWIQQDLHAFQKWVFDTLELLSDFVRRVVKDRRDAGLHRWATCLGEDLGARPYAWLRPDFCPPVRLSGSQGCRGSDLSDLGGASSC